MSKFISRGSGTKVGEMQLTNVLGLTGVMIILQMLDSMEMSFAMACCMLLLSDAQTGPAVAAVKKRLTRKNPLITLSDAQFKKEFRFFKGDIPRLIGLLNWPIIMRTPRGVVFGAEICLLMVLYRFAFPSTLNKLEITFGYPASACSNIVSEGVNLLYARFGTRLLELDIVLILSRLQHYKRAINRKSNSAASDCFGLIDGTVHHICKPWQRGRKRRGIRNQDNIQRACYSGHKRHHGIKFQSIVVPDGTVVQMFGPVEGRRHDVFLLNLSRLDEHMQFLPPHAFGYGDQAYPVRPWLLSPFKGPNKPIYQRRCNRNMRTVRISVEHGFKIVTTLWSHLKYIPAQKIFGTAVSKQYVVCTALTNIHNCMYPNQISQHFALQPPTVEEYFGLFP